MTTSPRALALGLAALLLAGCSTSGYTVGPGGLPTPTRTSSPSPRATPRAARTSPALATPAPVTSPGPAAVRYTLEVLAVRLASYGSHPTAAQQSDWLEYASGQLATASAAVPEPDELEPWSVALSNYQDALSQLLQDEVEGGSAVNSTTVGLDLTAYGTALAGLASSVSLPGSYRDALAL